MVELSEEKRIELAVQLVSSMIASGQCEFKLSRHEIGKLENVMFTLNDGEKNSEVGIQTLVSIFARNLSYADLDNE